MCRHCSTSSLQDRLALVACLWLVFGSGSPSVWAQTSPIVSVSAPNERLLLLQNGKMVKGVIRKSATGYVVIVTGGQMVLSFDQVRLEAADTEDAYRQLRDTLPDHTAAAHIELARWCVTNGMLDHARKELREALRREPDSTVAKNMLQRINDQLLTTKGVPAVAQRGSQFSMLGDAKPGIRPESLGGLSREAATEYMSKVQPILVNRCATAGCHGPGSGNSFELLRAKLGKAPPKNYSERNLAAVMERLNLERPLSSPLLVKLRGETKSLGVRQSHGSLSTAQHQTLRMWVESISKKPDAVGKPKAEVADDDNLSSEDSTTDSSSKSAKDRGIIPTDDRFFADENLFGKLLRTARRHVQA